MDDEAVYYIWDLKQVFQLFQTEEVKAKISRLSVMSIYKCFILHFP